MVTGYSYTPGNGLANLARPLDLAVGPDGTGWLADTDNHRIRRFYPDDWERDGIPDSKEGGTTPFVVGADDRLTDIDGDGQSNYGKYAGGSDPHSSGSRFEIKKLIHEGTGTVVIQWQSIVGRYYLVEHTDDFQTWTSIGNFSPGTGGLMSVSHDRGNQSQRFFRISAR